MTPDSKFEYHPEAIKEAWEAFHRYDERSETVAETFWQKLRRACHSITEHPHIGSHKHHVAMQAIVFA